MHRTTIQAGRSVLGTPPEACKVMAHHPGVNAEMVASALRRLHETASERVRAGMVDADADLAPDQCWIPWHVHELVATRPTGDDGGQLPGLGVRDLCLIVMAV